MTTRIIKHAQCAERRTEMHVRDFRTTDRGGLEKRSFPILARTTPGTATSSNLQYSRCPCTALKKIKNWARCELLPRHTWFAANPSFHKPRTARAGSRFIIHLIPTVNPLRPLHSTDNRSGSGPDASSVFPGTQKCQAKCAHCSTLRVACKLFTHSIQPFHLEKVGSTLFYSLLIIDWVRVQFGGIIPFRDGAHQKMPNGRITVRHGDISATGLASEQTAGSWAHPSSDQYMSRWEGKKG